MAFPESIIGLFVKVSLVLLEVLLPLVLIYFLNGYGKIFFVHFESLGGTIAYILASSALSSSLRPGYMVISIWGMVNTYLLIMPKVYILPTIN